MTITTIGLDLAKNVFQVHAVDHKGGGDCSQTIAPQQGPVLFR